MSPTKKKTPAPKKAPAKKAAPKAAAAKPAKPEKAAARKAVAKPAPASTTKKAAAAVPAAKASAKKADHSKENKDKEKAEKAPQKAASKVAAPAVTARAAKGTEAKSAPTKVEPAAKPRPATGKKAEDESGPPTKRAKPKKLVTPSGPRHPKLGYRWACFRCDAKFYDLGKEEPLCPKCGADQRDRPADEPRPSTADSARPRVVRPMAQLLDDDEPVAPLVEDDLGLDDVVESGDMFEGDGDITHLELDAAELEGETIEAGEADEF